jgi:HSP20 family protein
MTEPTKLPVKKEESKALTRRATQSWRTPLQSLRHEIDRLFADLDGSSWSRPFRHSLFDIRPYWLRESNWTSVPAVDITETQNCYEVTAELPGLDEKDIEVSVSNSCLIIKGEKQQEVEEKKKDYYVHEREFGSFERSFGLPESIDADKIEAIFKKGVLTVILPKTAEAQKSERKITVKAA